MQRYSPEMKKNNRSSPKPQWVSADADPSPFGSAPQASTVSDLPFADEPVMRSIGVSQHSFHAAPTAPSRVMMGKLVHPDMAFDGFGFNASDDLFATPKLHTNNNNNNNNNSGGYHDQLLLYPSKEVTKEVASLSSDLAAKATLTPSPVPSTTTSTNTTTPKTTTTTHVFTLPPPPLFLDQYSSFTCSGSTEWAAPSASLSLRDVDHLGHAVYGAVVVVLQHISVLARQHQQQHEGRFTQMQVEFLTQKDNRSIRGMVYVNNHPCSFAVQFYEDAESKLGDPKVLVEVQRRSGDCFSFQTFYRAVLVLLMGKHSSLAPFPLTVHTDYPLAARTAPVLKGSPSQSPKQLSQASPPSSPSLSSSQGQTSASVDPELFPAKPALSEVCLDGDTVFSLLNMASSTHVDVIRQAVLALSDLCAESLDNRTMVAAQPQTLPLLQSVLKLGDGESERVATQLLGSLVCPNSLGSLTHHTGSITTTAADSTAEQEALVAQLCQLLEAKRTELTRVSGNATYFERHPHCKQTTGNILRALLEFGRTKPALLQSVGGDKLLTTLTKLACKDGVIQAQVSALIDVIKSH